MDPITADDIIDRQRLRRKVSFWRIAALLTAVLAVIGLAVALGGDRFGEQSRDHIARISIDGTILGNRELLEVIDKARTNAQVKGALVFINSPGGTTAGSEALYDAVRKLADEKPVVAQIDTLGASGGYMVAAATDHIVARHSSIVGSIGVILQYPNITELLDNWGIDFEAIKSSPLKAEPTFYGTPPPGTEQMLQTLIDDSYQWFKDLVAERRGFDTQTIDRLADGSIYSGRDSLENGLVDALGGQDEAVAWLTEQGLDEDLTLIDWAPPSPTEGLFFLSAIADQTLTNLGLAPQTPSVLRTVQERLLLDGLISLWHAGGPLASPVATP